MGAYRSRLTFFFFTQQKMEEISQKTKFTTEEIRRWHEGFLEHCPTGKLSHFEFVTIYNQFFPTGNPTACSCFAFHTFDANGSGFIEFEEFLMALSETSHGIDAELELAVRLCVQDGDRSITRIEMYQIINAIFAVTGHHSLQMDGHSSTEDAVSLVNTIFEIMDSDGNGALSREEFMEGARQIKVS